MFSAMEFRGNTLLLIDQRLLPAQEEWISCQNVEQVAVAIEDMAIRGAPAIGCAAAFALVLAAKAFSPGATWGDFKGHFFESIGRLERTRPTAVNLFYALDRMAKAATPFGSQKPMSEVSATLEDTARGLYEDDLATCRAIGHHGADLFTGRQGLRILTHCNTGSLATAGYGTALGVIRALAERQQLEVVYADETRPWLQGARLTAFELMRERIPYKVIADSAAAYLMQRGAVDGVLVGADRIASNGDTANKIGTYALAVQCHHHRIPFYVAAPLSTFDVAISSGAEIAIEERSPRELHSLGNRLLTPQDAPVWNPSFDVTPASLITGIVTERGVLRAPYIESIAKLRVR